MEYIFQTGEGINQETYLDSATPTTNYGSNANIIVGRVSPPLTTLVEYLAIMRFDISELIGNYTIDTATLTLKPDGATSENQTLTVYRCGQFWSEGGATYNSSGLTTWTGSAGNPTTPTTSVAYAGGNVTFDIAELCEDAIANRGGVVNLVFKSGWQGSSLISRFATSANATPSNWPALTINTIDYTIEEGLKAFLSSETSLPAYPQNFPQAKRQYPCVSYTKKNGGREYNLISKIGIEHPTFSIDVFAETYSETVDASKEIKDALNGYRGHWFNGNIHNVIVRNVSDAPPERKTGTDQHLFHQVVDCEIWSSRA